MTAVLYGVQETPYPRTPELPDASQPYVWPRDPQVSYTLSLNPCAVCGFPNAEAGDSHERCRKAIERAEERAQKKMLSEQDAVVFLKEKGWTVVDDLDVLADRFGKYTVYSITITQSPRTDGEAK